MTMNGEAPSGADGHFRSHNERQSGDAYESAQPYSSEQNETTLRDLSDMQKCYDDEDGDDSNWNPISHSVRTQLHSSEQNETTLKDLSDMQECYVDEDDDDSDWDPANHSISGNERWFCTNCTGLNMDNVSHCVVCGEYKNSGILLHGCFASRIGEGAVNPADLDVTIETQEPVKSPTAIGFDERMLLHYEVDTKSHPHPERPDRVRAIAASLAFAGIFPGKCFLIPAREISEEELGLVHSVDNIEAVRCTKHLLYSYFTADTYANKYSACAARIAAGFCSDLATAIMTGKAKNGFALVRPPGHHAGVEQAMGFCLHNNAAVAAIAAQSAGAKKVLIVDWDVHHGNGTQEIFQGNKSVLYISLHRHENGSFYPGTGAADEVGIMEGEGYSINVPWRTGGIGDNDYIFAFQNIVLPIAFEFAPDLTIISAGFDAARGDPLGGCDVTPIGYAQLTHMLCSLSQGKLLVILEGGYNLRSIASSATAVTGVLLGEVPTKKMNDVVPTESGLQTILEVLKIQLRFWPVLTSTYNQMQTKLASTIVPDRKKQAKKQRIIGPIWWKWGSKRLVYRCLYSEPRAKLNGHSRKLRRSISL